MPPVLNLIGVTVSMYGNHDFDFGEDIAISLTQEMNHPWLLSNMKGGKSGEALGKAVEMVVIRHAGLKIGVFGVAEDWTGSH